MKLLSLVLLSYIISFTSANPDQCGDYIKSFDGCFCESETDEKLLYGEKSFFVKCDGQDKVLSVNSMDSSSVYELLKIDDQNLPVYMTEIRDHITLNNEFYEIKSRCPFGSIEAQMNRGELRLSLNEIGHIISKVVDMAKYFYNEERILTNLNPGQLCLDSENNPRIFDVRRAKLLNEKQPIDSYFQYLPPEYFQSYVENQPFYFDGKFLSYQIGYLFYFLVKKKYPFTLSDTPQEDIWAKRVHFGETDYANFVHFVKKLITNHHIRLRFEEVCARIRGDKKNHFDFGMTLMNQNQFFIIEDNILRVEQSESDKISIPVIICSLLAFLGMLFLGTFLFCKDSFWIFVQKNTASPENSLDNSRECSLDVENPEKSANQS